MKKLFFFLILGLSTVAIYEFTSWNGTLEIKDLKKEAFKCSGKGLAGKTVYATFEIDPDNETLTFSHSGGLIGSVIKYPKKIRYRIKSSSGTEILTHENTYSWTNFAGKNLNYITNVYTKDKKTFEYDFVKTNKKTPPNLFSNCQKK
jgi:hypothetical protein|tara:strand:- start:125 stop:565 length:441 start_codon:yes stop_codon:yes gene_type:complete